jgi:outer membrane protein
MVQMRPLFSLWASLSLTLGFPVQAQVGEMSADGSALNAAASEIKLNPAQMLALADRARDARDFELAERLYRAVSQNADVDVHIEARCRLGMMLADHQHKYQDAAIEFRHILDEKPSVLRVRLELARMHTLLGDDRKARREFRAAEAIGLTPEVEQMVRFYSNALAARKRSGLRLELALAPDTNVNRATKSDTLHTVIGNFALDKDARRQSGMGIALRGQGFARISTGKKIDFLIRALGNGNLYRNEQFNDVAASVQGGGEYTSGRDRIAAMMGPTWRWYGNRPYSFSLGGTVTWQHPIAKRAEIQIEGGINHVDNRRNWLQDADNFSLSATLDRAFTARSGGGIQFSGNREVARDPGYSNVSFGTNAYLYREIGRTTAVFTLGYSHLESDARLLLYPQKRADDRFNLSLAGTFRGLSIGGFAPLLRLRWEQSRSTLAIYDYQRLAGEFGVASAF